MSQAKPVCFTSRIAFRRAKRLECSDTRQLMRFFGSDQKLSFRSQIKADQLPWSAQASSMLSIEPLADTTAFGITWNAWKIIGFTGSLVFGLRFLLQWIASERAHQSVIPFGFWECS